MDPRDDTPPASVAHIDVFVRAKRPWSTRAAFDDEDLRTAAPGAWPGAEHLVLAAWWVLVPLGIAIVGPGLILVVAAAGWIDVSTPLRAAATPLILTAIVLGSPLMIWFIFRGVPKVERRVVAARGRLCPSCGHDLAGRPFEDRREPQPCPECGDRVSSRDAVLFWLRQVRRAHDP
ncbi:MAG: hypothetical protein AAF297_00190 [Planctomycetota bacterium]